MTYNYDCNKCGVITVERKMSEPTLDKCPHCNSPVKRIFSAAPSIAKCNGFFGKSK